MFIAEAVRETGLGERLARLLLDRYTSSYTAALIGVSVVATLLTFLMPATIGRVLLLVPIISALAARMGFEPGSRGYNGLLLCAIATTYHSGTGVLPANAPNLVLAGAADTLYHFQVTYAEYFLVQFPVMGLLKLGVSVGVLLLLFPAQPKAAPTAAPLAPMTATERRLSVILLVAILFWATDFLHHIKPGWIALVAAIVCMMPRVGVIPMSAFNEKVRYGPFFYVASILGLGSVMTDAGITKAIGDMLTGALDIIEGRRRPEFRHPGRHDDPDRRGHDQSRPARAAGAACGTFCRGDGMAAQGRAHDHGDRLFDHAAAAYGAAGGRGIPGGRNKVSRRDAVYRAHGADYDRRADAARLFVVAPDWIFRIDRSL